MITIAHRTINEVEAILAHRLQCVGEKAALASATAAEHIRALIYGAAMVQPDAFADCTVHTTRLTTSARRVVELAWPEYSSRVSVDSRAPNLDLSLSTLQRMAALGDAVDTGGGRWLAAPLRIVAAESGGDFLLIGAAPSIAVHQRLGVAPFCSGASRFVGQVVLDAGGSADLVQSADEWMGPLPALKEWTLQVLAAHEARMEAVDGLPTEQLEIYAPEVARAQRRTGRWVPAKQIGIHIDGPRPCRPLERYTQSWDRPQYLAHFHLRHGELELRRAATIPRELALRLCFGLDVMMQTPRQQAITYHRETFSIDRPLTLPKPESRIHALGWQDYAGQGGSDKLTFQARALPFVTRAFRRLSINFNVTPRALP